MSTELKDSSEYGFCRQCTSRLRALAIVIDTQLEENRPNPTPDDHYYQASGGGTLCAGDYCEHPTFKKYLLIRQNPVYGDQEITEGTWDEIEKSMADTILDDGGAPVKLAYQEWRSSLPGDEDSRDEPWVVLRWYREDGDELEEPIVEEVIGTFTIYLTVGDSETI